MTFYFWRVMSTEPRIEPTATNQWVFIEDWDCPFKNHEITVPKGFVTDGCSIPRFVWTLCGHPMLLPRSKACFRHDFQYTVGPLKNPDPRCEERKQADKDLRDYMRDLGMGKIRSWFYYKFVRLFGGSHWKVEGQKAKCLNCQ